MGDVSGAIFPDDATPKNGAQDSETGGDRGPPLARRRDTIITDAELEAYGEAFGVKRSEIIVDRVTGDQPPGHPGQPPFRGVFSRRSLSVGCSMMASDLVALRSERMTSTVAGQFVIRLPFQSGDVRIGQSSPRALSLRPNQALLIAMRSDIHLDGKFQRGRRYTDFFVHIAPGAQLDDPLSERIAARMDRDLVAQFPVPQALSARALAICQAEMDDCVQGLLAESCALELLACGIASDGEAGLKGPAITQGDRKKMAIIRDRLLAEPHRDHRLVDLARDVGICVTALKTKFHGVFGQSVMSYLRDARLDRARDGITREGWTVSQAAYLVGYRHQSSFSVAFQRRFGFPPSKLPRA